MQKKVLLFISFILLVGLVFSGCSRDDDAAYVVGTEPTFPPFEMTDDEGEIIGFDIDLIKAIAEAEGFEVEISNLGFDALIPALQSGNIDIIASGMSITEARKDSVSFSDPYIDASLRIAVTADNDEIQSIEDLEGKIAVVQIGTTGAEKAYELKDEGILEEVKTYGTVDVVFMELLNRGADCVINDAPVTTAYMARNEGEIKMVGEALVGDQYGIAVAKDNDELIEKINSGLETLKEEGIYDDLIEKYF